MTPPPDAGLLKTGTGRCAQPEYRKDCAMISDLMSWVVQGYRAPRASMRRFLGAENRLQAAALLFLLGFAIESVLQIMLLALLSDGQATPAGSLLGLLVLRAIAFAGFAGLIHLVCRAAGGRGQWADTALALGWNMVVTAFLAPLPILAAQGGGLVQSAQDGGPTVLTVDPGGVLFLGLYAAVAIWLLSAYLAEAHGFERVWRVAASFIGASFLAGALMMLMGGA